MIFKVSPNAVFETFDTEVVVINLVSGSYYALDAVALEIWSLLQEGHSLPQIVTATQARTTGDPDFIESAITAFTRELQQEDLIVAVPESAASNVPLGALTHSDETKTARVAFVTPTLTKFTDMQDLLLLDPIHEVDEMGWPHAKPAPESPKASNADFAPSSEAPLD